MKKIKGIMLIVITTLITFLLWFFATAAASLSPLERARHITAGLALNGFFLNFLLATRSKVLENGSTGWTNSIFIISTLPSRLRRS